MRENKQRRHMVDLTGHTAGAAATCTTAQTCTKCSAQIAAALGHDFTGKTESDTYLKSSGSCVSLKTYYYHCTRCSVSAKNNGGASFDGSSYGSHDTYGAYLGYTDEHGCQRCQYKCRNCPWTGSSYWEALPEHFA